MRETGATVVVVGDVDLGDDAVDVTIPEPTSETDEDGSVRSGRRRNGEC